MNKIWLYLLVISISVGIFRGLAPEMVDSIFSSTKLATENSLSIIGMICLWSGIMKISEECGLVNKLSKLVSPLINYLFPNLNQLEAKGTITLNFTANLLGLGNVATPLGLASMRKAPRNQ